MQFPSGGGGGLAHNCEPRSQIVNYGSQKKIFLIKKTR